MAHRPQRAALLALALLTAAGCRSEQRTSLEAAARLCKALHALPEERRAGCCHAPGGIVLDGQCTEALSAAIREGAIAIPAARVDACAAAMERALEGCGWVGPFAAAPPPECQGVIEGRRKSLEPCRSSLECAQGLACAGGGPSDPGRCAPPGRDGAVCETAIDALAVYARQDAGRAHPPCAGQCRRHRCGPLATAACKASEECGPGRRCADGACVPGAAREGEACTGGDCGEGLRCLGGTCRAPLGEGALCSQDLDCRGGCRFEGAASRCGMRCDLR
jgi:hypothetical protein